MKENIEKEELKKFSELPFVFSKRKNNFPPNDE